METYEELLDRAYKTIKVVSVGSERFNVPKATGQISGSSTVITNLGAIASYLRRPIEQLAKYLTRELATQGDIDKDRLVLRAKLNSAKVNEKLESYVKEFVLCPECKKPDTEIVSEHAIKVKHCLACGAKTPIRSKL